MRYNIWRPIMLVLVALIARSLVTSVCLLFGLEPEAAENVGYIGMVAAALIMYNRIKKSHRK